jgi:hypothetical protein
MVVPQTDMAMEGGKASINEAILVRAASKMNVHQQRVALTLAVSSCQVMTLQLG